jgi:hypothetical protein
MERTIMNNTAISANLLARQALEAGEGVKGGDARMELEMHRQGCQYRVS